MSAAAVALRPPTAEDAAAVWSLVRDTGVLDVNSSYAYVLLCTHHAATSAVALRGGQVVGFVTGYRLPTRPHAWFLWQIGVATSARGLGIASRLVDHVLDRPGMADVRWLHTTVAPSNTASRALFEAVARSRDASLTVTTGFAAALFPESHEDEELLVLGPFDRSP